MCLTVGIKTNFSEIFRSLHELKINKIAITLIICFISY